MAVLYYTGHIVYAIAIHTKEQMMLWLKTMINYAPIAPNPLTSDMYHPLILHYHHCRQSACAPNFSKFPWGVQVCSLKFGSWINSQYNVEYRSAWRQIIYLK